MQISRRNLVASAFTGGAAIALGLAARRVMADPQRGVAVGGQYNDSGSRGNTVTKDGQTYERLRGPTHGSDGKPLGDRNGSVGGGGNKADNGAPGGD
jgi:hypothetical protein